MKRDAKGTKAHALAEWLKGSLRQLEMEQMEHVAGLGLQEIFYAKQFLDGSCVTVAVLTISDPCSVVARGVAIRAIGDSPKSRVGRVIARGRALRAYERRQSSSPIRQELYANAAALWWSSFFGDFKSAKTEGAATMFTKEELDLVQKRSARAISRQNEAKEEGNN